MRWFFEWWGGLNTLLKVGIALVPLVASTILRFIGIFRPSGSGRGKTKVPDNAWYRLASADIGSQT